MPFKSEKQRKWMWANDPEMAKKWEKEEKMKKETKVRQLIRKMVSEIMSESKRVKYKKNDVNKYNKLVKKGKSVMVQTAYGDQFAWEDGSRHGVFASEEDGREIELSHDDIDIVMIEGKINETTVRLSPKKDASFEPGQFVQLLGIKGVVKLDKKSVAFLAKWIRSNSGKHGMGWSFTEGKLTEATDSYVVWSPLLNKVYDGPVSEKEALRLIKKYSKQGQYHVGMQGTKYYNKTKLGKKNPVKEGKLNEAKTLTLPNGVRAKIEFKGVTFQPRKGKPVFLDRSELHKFFQATSKYLRESKLKEAKERNYKEEYKKYGSSKKAKKYRAELNAYNRKKGTYGNGDGKDASHKGGKIVGFEAESKNRGRAEKSRLKKEGKLNEISSSEAKTLLKQLGGNRFMAMTGAKDFGIGKDGLHFKIGRNAKSISHVVINLSSMDLYDIKFLRVRAGKIKVVKKLKGVYADQLGTMFKKHTGMNVRL